MTHDEIRDSKWALWHTTTDFNYFRGDRHYDEAVMVDSEGAHPNMIVHGDDVPKNQWRSVGKYGLQRIHRGLSMRVFAKMGGSLSGAWCRVEWSVHPVNGYFDKSSENDGCRQGVLGIWPDKRTTVTGEMILEAVLKCEAIDIDKALASVAKYKRAEAKQKTRERVAKVRERAKPKSVRAPSLAMLDDLLALIDDNKLGEADDADVEHIIRYARFRVLQDKATK